MGPRLGQFMIVSATLLFALSSAVQGQTFWTGGVNASWDAATHNWVSGSPLVGAAYVDGAAVRFGDTNPVTGGVVANVGGTASIAIQAAGVSPGSIVFTNIGPGGGGVNYLIGGGSIRGTTGLTLLGTDGVGGLIVLASGNDFTGQVSIQAGELNVRNPLALGNTSGVTVASGAAFELQSPGGPLVFGASANASTPIPLALSGSGIAGTGALRNQAGANVYAGPVTIGTAAGGATVVSLINSPSDSLTLTGGVSVLPGATLTVAGPGRTFVSSGQLSLAANTSAGPTALQVNGGGTTEINSAPSYGDGSSLAVAGGLLRLNVTSGSPLVGHGVTAHVTSGGTLELAGATSAMSGPTNRVTIINDSDALGIDVTGTGQRVGGVDGSGDTHLAAGSDLTVDHLIQSALVIGGTADSPASLSIAASDAGGNPLAALTAELSASPPSGAGFAASSALTSPPGNDFGGSLATTGLSLRSPVDGGTVPEPSSFLLVLGMTSLIGIYVAWNRGGVGRSLRDA